MLSSSPSSSISSKAFSAEIAKCRSLDEDRYNPGDRRNDSYIGKMTSLDELERNIRSLNLETETKTKRIPTENDETENSPIPAVEQQPQNSPTYVCTDPATLPSRGPGNGDAKATYLPQTNPNMPDEPINPAKYFRSSCSTTNNNISDYWDSSCAGSTIGNVPGIGIGQSYSVPSDNITASDYIRDAASGKYGPQEKQKYCNTTTNKRMHGSSMDKSYAYPSRHLQTGQDFGISFPSSVPGFQNKQNDIGIFNGSINNMSYRSLPETGSDPRCVQSGFSYQFHAERQPSSSFNSVNPASSYTQNKPMHDGYNRSNLHNQYRAAQYGHQTPSHSISNSFTYSSDQLATPPFHEMRFSPVEDICVSTPVTHEIPEDDSVSLYNDTGNLKTTLTDSLTYNDIDRMLRENNTNMEELIDYCLGESKKGQIDTKPFETPDILSLDDQLILHNDAISSYVPEISLDQSDFYPNGFDLTALPVTQPTSDTYVPPTPAAVQQMLEADRRQQTQDEQLQQLLKSYTHQKEFQNCSGLPTDMLGNPSTVAMNPALPGPSFHDFVLPQHRTVNNSMTTFVPTMQFYQMHQQTLINTVTDFTSQRLQSNPVAQPLSVPDMQSYRMSQQHVSNASSKSNSHGSPNNFRTVLNSGMALNQEPQLSLNAATSFACQSPQPYFVSKHLPTSVSNLNYQGSPKVCSTTTTPAPTTVTPKRVQNVHAHFSNVVTHSTNRFDTTNSLTTTVHNSNFNQNLHPDQIYQQSPSSAVTLANQNSPKGCENVPQRFFLANLSGQIPTDNFIIPSPPSSSQIQFNQTRQHTQPNSCFTNIQTYAPHDSPKQQMSPTGPQASINPKQTRDGNSATHIDPSYKSTVRSPMSSLPASVAGEWSDDFVKEGSSPIGSGERECAMNYAPRNQRKQSNLSTSSRNTDYREMTKSISGGSVHQSEIASNDNFQKQHPCIQASSDSCSASISSFSPLSTEVDASPGPPSNISSNVNSETISGESVFNLLDYDLDSDSVEDRSKVEAAASTAAQYNDLLARDEEGDTVLHSAMINDDWYLVKALLKRYEAEGLISRVINAKNKRKQTVLCLAVISNKPSVVDQLIKGGADVTVHISVQKSSKIGNSFNQPIHFAAARGNQWYPTLERLLKSDNIDLNAMNSDGCTPLHCAIQGHRSLVNGVEVSCIGTIRLLLEHGSNPNQPDVGFDKTPLHYAILKKSYELVKCLLNFASRCQTADQRSLMCSMMNARTGTGYTALHLAASMEMTPEEDHQRLIQLLLSKGADPSNKNSDGQLPRELTRNQKIIEVLKGKRIAGLGRHLSNSVSVSMSPNSERRT